MNPTSDRIIAPRAMVQEKTGLNRKLKLVQPLEETYPKPDRYHHTKSSAKPKQTVWLDGRSPMRPYCYAKGGRKWNRADQESEGMKWDYYRTHRKTIPLFEGTYHDPKSFVSTTTEAHANEERIIGYETN